MKKEAKNKSHDEPITLDEFIERAPLTIEAFKDATVRRFEEGDEDMDPSQSRPEAWWWRDVAAYLNFTDLQDELGGEEEPRHGKKKMGRDDD